jgi:two-component system sensor kinase FixL
VRNAIDAMTDQQQAIRRLTIQTRLDVGNAVVVAVHDTGPGLSVEAADQVFNPFYTTKSHGMGMGLTISGSIIKAHEGEVWVKTNDDGGCTFGFSLPITGGG